MTYVTWFEAKQHCLNLDGNLMEPSKFTKALKIQEEMGSGFWLGCTDILEEGVWVCDPDGEVYVDVELWAGSEPNNAAGNEDCMLLWDGSGIADAHCIHHLAPIVCDFD